MTKALISVTGQDTTGIIARVATKLSELNINILDITQTILSGCFTMMMVENGWFPLSGRLVKDMKNRAQSAW